MDKAVRPNDEPGSKTRTLLVDNESPRPWEDHSFPKHSKGLLIEEARPSGFDILQMSAESAVEIPILLAVSLRLFSTVPLVFATRV